MFKDKLICQPSQPIYAHLHDTTISNITGRLHETAYTTRRSSHDDSSLSQRRPATQMFDDLTHRPNHVVRICLLSDMPVDLGAEFEILGIRYRTGQHNRWPDRGKPIK